MARKFRQDREEKVDLKRTESSFSDDIKLNKANQISRRNDDVKNISVGIYDIDLAFKTFLEKDVKPTIVEDGKFIPVPVMYSSPENWASAQKDGFMRDSNGKVLTPLISFKRNGLDINTEYSKLKVLTDNDTSRSFVRKYTPQNKYDAFSQLINQKKVEEYHIVDTPDYVNITYDVIVWCDYMADLNKIVEQIVYFQGGAFGDRYKFQIKGESYSFETTNGVGEERIVRSNVTLTVKAYIVPEDRGNRVVNHQKAFGISKIIFNTEASLGSTPLVADAYTPPPSYVLIQNSDDSYNTRVTNGGSLELPDVIVSNSDGSYSVTYPSVQDVELPDETINIVDEDGNPLDSITFPVYTDPNIDISTYCPPPVGATLMKTGQTTSYRTGDDGDLQEGRDVDFFTLEYNNPFGNTNRFTDELGGSTYANDWVIDWSTYDNIAGTVLGYYRVIQLSAGGWNQAIDDSLANTYGTFSGCRLPNINEYINIVKWSNSFRFFDYTPFNFGLNVWLWSSTTSNSSTIAAYAMGFSTASTIILSQNKANSSPRYIPVRTFTVTGTTLT